VVPSPEKIKEKQPKDLYDLPLFGSSRPEHPLLQEIKDLDIQNLTPLEALNRLNQLKEKARVSVSHTQPISLQQYNKGKRPWEK
jgi:hypothetical protein